MIFQDANRRQTLANHGCRSRGTGVQLTSATYALGTQTNH
jgi:hypothetical protein